jgi:serine/threonine-protein kinase
MNAAEDVPTRPGDILAGKYRVEKVLGAGAMGVVVAAMHEDLRELRAIKFMLPSMLSDAEGVERFLREARAAVRLKSQHVAKIHDIGRLETGAPYMVMEYLEGSDLKHLLEARGALPVHEAVGYMLQVCEAIAEAHALGIVHRDLKPANLFLASGAGGAPCIKVLDFGIAKVLGSGPDAGDMTRTSALLGTPLYMSPEQMRGARSIDGRSDVWALGAILYRMLTGRTPFSGSSVTEICAAVVADQPDPPAMLRPDIPPALEAAVMQCLEKSPARRFATAAQFAAAIAPFAARVAAPAAPQPQRLSPALNGTAILDVSAPVPFAAAARPVAAQPAPAAMVPHPAPQPVPIAAPPASVPAPIAAPAPMAAPAPPMTPSAAGNTTQASTWTQAGAAPAAPKSSGKGLVIAAVAVVVIGGGAAVAAMQFARKPAPPPAATPVATQAAAAPTAEPSATPTASAETSAGAEPTAAPSATATATAAPSAAAIKPSAAARPGPAKGRAKDAFGSERK